VDGYYINAVAGNDANPGTQAAPWKTLARAASAKLISGQALYLACGQTWRETLALGVAQLASDTHIAGYGAACATSKAIVSGAENLSGSWRKSGKIWVKKVSTTLPKVSRLFVNGVTLRTAQWPNYGGVGNEYALASATMVTGRQTLLASVADAVQLAGKDLVGATVQVRSKPWYIDQRTVQGYAAGALTLDTPTNYPMEGGSGYVLQDKLWMMDAPGEFFHDTVNGMLYVYPQGASAQSNLNGALVEGAVRDSALLITGVQNVTVSNVRATMTRGDGIAVINAPGVRLDGIEASGNARSGVRIALNTQLPVGVAGATIANSLLSDNWQYGVDASAANGVYITGNTVMQTGTLGTAGWSHAAIMIGDGGAVSGNTIDQAAYHGIRYSGGGGSVISDNLITNFCTRLTDGAGVYTWNGPKTAPRTTGLGSVVRNNRIGSAKANLNGVAGLSSPLVIGIYLDDFSQNALVQGNTVFNVPFGIKVHNSSNHTIDSNQIWLTTQAGIWASMDQTDADYMTGNVYTSNVVMPYPSTSGTFPQLPDVTAATPYWFTHLMSGAAALGAGRNQFSGNRIIALESGAKPVAIVQGVDGHRAWP
jgi:parallel beta-helix repeat protein